MKEESLKTKALRAAIRQLDNTWNREAAREVYKTWTVFHKEPTFKAAVKKLQLKLKEREGK